MELSDAAAFFNDTEFADTYGAATFMGRLLPYADGVRSSPSTPRRILETEPDTVIPARRTVTDVIRSQVYIVADSAVDGFQGAAVRKKMPAIPVTGGIKVQSIAQVLVNAGGTVDAYGALSYIKRTYQDDKSTYLSNYEVYFAGTQTVNAGEIITHNGRYYLASQRSRLDDIGFGVVEVVELDYPISAVDITTYSGTLNSTTNKFDETGHPSTPVFIEAAIIDFVHEALGAKEVKNGDKAISFLKTAVTSVRSGDIVGNYTVLSVSDEGSSWKVHGRRVS